MTFFFGVALAFVAIAVFIVLRPLLKSAPAAEVDRATMNRDIYRDQLADIDRDLQAGTIDVVQAEQARQELERRVLEEVAAPLEAPVRRKRGLGVAATIALVLPIASIALYLHLGNLEGLNAVPHVADSLSSITPEQFEQLTQKLAKHLQDKPDDVTGWTMLGRAYRATGRDADAAMAFGRAAALKPADANLLADQAESLALSRNKTLAGEPTQLLERALKVDPDNAKALALAGSAAFDRKDYRAAIGYWERLLKHPETGGELAQALQTAVMEARALSEGRKPSPAKGSGRVTGVVTLDPTLKGRAQADDAVFIFARAAAGPRMPLAIAKVKVRDLPYHFELDDSMAMMPELKISGFAEILVGARVSKSGSATPASGDLEGLGPVVKPGASGIQVKIDEVVK